MSNLITIDQLLESVDLDFEPRWATKDKNGRICLWDSKPIIKLDEWLPGLHYTSCCGFSHLKLSEFSDKDWTECVYEVPQKTTEKIKKLDEHAGNMQLSSASMTRNQFVANTIMKKINEIVDVVNELKGGEE